MKFDFTLLPESEHERARSAYMEGDWQTLWEISKEYKLITKDICRCQNSNREKQFRRWWDYAIRESKI